jgi:hypothetical protein
MLAPNLLPKAVPHSGSRLLLGFIVCPARRLAEGQPPLGHTPPRPSCPPERPGGPDAGDPRSVASLQKRARFLALRLGVPAPLLPYVVLPRPTQPARPSPGARALRLLQRAFAEDLTEPSAIYRVMDTTLIPAMARVRVRASRKGLFAGQASFGRSASKT